MRGASLVTLLALALGAAATACGSPLVGGECKPGARAEGGRCAPIDAGGADAGDGGPDVPHEGGDTDPDSPVDVPDAAPDGDPPCGCDVGELCCEEACVRPARDPLHCGGCGIACGEGEVCALGVCLPDCPVPLTMCGAECVSLENDPDHCGDCDRACGSGICAGGACPPSRTSHLVVLGHDYRTARVGMNRLVGNAVFLADGAPVRVLAYEGTSELSSVSHVGTAIDQVGAAKGRVWTRTLASPATVPLYLADADVLLVYPQHGSSDEDLLALGASWATALRTFLERGGVVVLLDAPADNRGTYQILDAAGLFSASGRVDVSLDILDVAAPGDAVAVDVPFRYRGESRTVRYETSETEVVVQHPDGPVVVHRVLPPGTLDGGVTDAGDAGDAG